MCKCLGKVIYAIVQLVAFVFILAGTPIDQFRPKKDKVEDWTNNSPCLTLWGRKEKCLSTKFDQRPADAWPLCKARVNRFKAAEALAIVSIGIFGVACLLGFIHLCCCECIRWVCLVLNIVGIATACVIWACMVESYLRRIGSDPGVMCGPIKNSVELGSTGTNFGAGFVLIVVGWCLNIINIIFLMLPC